MELSSYSLSQEKYTWMNALLWGNFVEHCKLASHASILWKDRLVHALIATSECLPIIGQIVSIFEKAIFDVWAKSTLVLSHQTNPVANQSDPCPVICSQMSQRQRQRRISYSTEVFNGKAEEFDRQADESNRQVELLRTQPENAERQRQIELLNRKATLQRRLSELFRAQAERQEEIQSIMTQINQLNHPIATPRRSKAVLQKFLSSKNNEDGYDGDIE